MKAAPTFFPLKEIFQLYITDIDEVVSLLRSKLTDYLAIKLGDDFSSTKKFKCFAHDDNSPSMHVNPKTSNETVKCFSCGFHGDIFTVANHFDNLPTNGAEWLKVTIPELCDTLNIDYSPVCVVQKFGRNLTGGFSSINRVKFMFRLPFSACKHLCIVPKPSPNPRFVKSRKVGCWVWKHKYTHAE